MKRGPQGASQSGRFVPIVSASLAGARLQSRPHFNNPNSHLMSQTRFRFPVPPAGVDLNRLTIVQVCNLVPTSRRRVRYLVSIGAVPPPSGNTKAARYTWAHVQKIQSLNKATKRRELTAREAAEVRVHGFRKANGRPHVDGTTTPVGVTRVEHVYQLTDHIRVTVPSDLSAIQRGILARVLRAARLTVHEQGAVVREFGAALRAKQDKESAKKARADARRKATAATPANNDDIGPKHGKSNAAVPERH